MPEELDLEQIKREASEVGPLLARCPDIEPRRFRDGDLLIREGETSKDLFLVLQGSLVVEHEAPDGSSRIMAHLECQPETPCFVGEMAYLGAQARTASVRAVGGGQALCLQPAHVDVILESFPLLTRCLCRQFTQRLAETNQALRDLRARFDLAPRRHLAQPGETLFAAGEQATTVFQLVMGRVRIERHGMIALLGPEDLPGGFLGLEAFLCGQPHDTSAAAEEPCLLAAIEASHRHAFLRNYPALALAVLDGRP